MALRIEADVDTAFTGAKVADVLRGVVEDYGDDFTPQANAMFDALADVIERHGRPATPGTRATATVSAPEAGGLALTSVALLRMVLDLVREAAAASGRPGATGPVLELTLCVVLGDVPAVDAGEECDER
jgi:hypothetical protein